MLLRVFQEYLFLVTAPSLEAIWQGPSSNKSPVADEAPGPPRGTNEMHEWLRRNPGTKRVFVPTVGPINEISRFWRMPGFEEPKE